MNADELAAVLGRDIVDLAPSLALRAPVRVDYVPNPGGLVTANFRVRDDRAAYHVKLAPPGHDADAVRRWARVADVLAERYRAPRMLASFDLDGWFGAVFELLPGAPPERGLSPDVLDRLVPLLDRLHADEELALMLEIRDDSCRTTFLQYHIAICEADLDELERDDAFPPFVDEHLAAWMRTETAQLRSLAESSRAFDEVPTTPIHGDLWFGNVMVHGTGWHVIDWDDLRIGDPAHDLALALFTAVDDGADATRWVGGRDASFLERFELAMRAVLWTCVVDPLSDWAEAANAPSVAERTRAHREAFHRWALDRYRARYGAAQ